jgi:hypothetical protein
MTKSLVRPATVLSVLTAMGLLVSFAPSGCGGSSGGTRATGGATGSGGRVNVAGSNGTAGSSGSGGMAGGGTGGGGGTCTAPTVTGALDCAGGVNPAATAVTDWSPAAWNNGMGKWHTAACDLTGSIFAGAKPAPQDAAAASSMTSAVTFGTTNPAYEMKGTVQSGEYAYGGMQFDKCVNTTTYTGVSFTLGGNAAGCDLFLLVQTFDQQAATNHGGCPTGGSCYSFPKKQLTIDPSGSGTVTVHFTDLTGGLPTDPAAIKAEIVGLQWQFQSPSGVDGGPQPACNNIDVTVDDVAWVTD